ncbi:5-oxoprolinase-like protein [Tanacetum coccineum]
MDGWFSFICRCDEYGRTYNRPVERSGDGKPSVGSNSQSVSINENVFQFFSTSMLKLVLGKQIKVDMSAIRSVVFLLKVKIYCVISELLKNICLMTGFDDVGLRDVGGRWVGWDSTVLFKWKRVKTSRTWWVFAIGIRAQMFISSWVVGGEAACFSDMTYRIIATEFAYWAPNIESIEIPPKNVNNDSVSPSSRVLREEDVRGVESDLVDSFEEGEIRDDSVLYNDGCIKDCMEKNLEDDAGEILGVHSQGDCGNVTIDDNEDVTPVIVPEKDSIIAPPSTPPGNDLNIAAESGSWWIDYIGPLTSDEIDSDKRWSYRDPNGNIHGLFSLAQLRSWKDYFPSDLQIWSYYDNVKEAILLINALLEKNKGCRLDRFLV